MSDGMKIQAKHVPAIDMLRAIDELSRADKKRNPQGYGHVTTWDVAERFAGIPEKVIRAKLAALVRRKVIDGCTCGCRGDFAVTPYGNTCLANPVLLAG